MAITATSLRTTLTTGSVGAIADANAEHQAVNDLTTVFNGWQTTDRGVKAGALAVNVKDPAYNAVGDGTADDTTAIQAAITAASAAGGQVYLPPGIYKITSSLALKDNVHLLGAGMGVTTIRPTSAVTTAVLLGSSGDTVTNARLAYFTIDAQWSVTGQSISGVQITNGSYVTIDSLKVTNVGVAGILLQGLGSGGGTPDSTVSRCLIDGTGLVDGTTGFGIIVKDASSRCKIIDNTVLNVKGGMGIGMNGSGGTGYPTFGTIARNTIDMQNSTTGFEAIGITASCTNTNIADNNIVHSYDNGISVSAANCVVVGNNIDMSYNHGISSAGNYNVITGNRVRNPGQQADAAYGGITLISTTGNVVAGNVIYDDQGTPTMSHGVKLNTSGGNNRIGPNYNQGWSVSGVLGALSTDYVIASSLNEDIRRRDLLAAVGGSFSPLQAPVGGAAQTSQAVVGVAMYLYAGETVTNILCAVTVAGAGTAPTGLKLGLWSSAATPVCLAATTDLAADARWTSQGWKVNALSSPYVVPSSGVYYPVFWINGAFATTNVQLAVGPNNSFTGAPIGSNPRMFGALKTSAATMAVSDTGTYGAAGNIPFLGWS